MLIDIDISKVVARHLDELQNLLNKRYKNWKIEETLSENSRNCHMWYKYTNIYYFFKSFTIIMLYIYLN